MKNFNENLDWKFLLIILFLITATFNNLPHINNYFSPSRVFQEEIIIHIDSLYSNKNLGNEKIPAYPHYATVVYGGYANLVKGNREFLDAGTRIIVCRDVTTKEFEIGSTYNVLLFRGSSRFEIDGQPYYNIMDYITPNGLSIRQEEKRMKATHNLPISIIILSTPLLFLYFHIYSLMLLMLMVIPPFTIGLIGAPIISYFVTIKRGKGKIPFLLITLQIWVLTQSIIWSSGALAGIM